MKEQKEHKRRVRYKGTHPRNYNEKYKELNPEKYQGTIEHVIQKGSTPAGMHIPILVDEILDFLKIAAVKMFGFLCHNFTPHYFLLHQYSLWCYNLY